MLVELGIKLGFTRAVGGSVLGINTAIPGEFGIVEHSKVLPHDSTVPVVRDPHNAGGAGVAGVLRVSELVCIRRAPGGFSMVVCFWVVAKVDEESVFAAQWHSVVNCGRGFSGVGNVVAYGDVDGFSGTDGHGEVVDDVEVLSDFVWFCAVGVGELEFAGEGAGFNEVVRAGEVKLVEKIGVEDTLTKCVGVCEFDTQVLGELVIKADGACCRDMEGRVVNPAVCFDQRWAWFFFLFGGCFWV